MNYGYNKVFFYGPLKLALNELYCCNAKKILWFHQYFSNTYFMDLVNNFIYRKFSQIML